ncbi:MAG: galactose oxidase-like domain-containing protein [Nannocystales bacterium]
MFQDVAEDALSVTAPSTSAVTPPGFYVLFVDDGASTPSAAKFVQVTDLERVHGPSQCALARVPSRP